MRLIHGTRSLKQPFTASVLTIGNFDGVHLGHQALIKRVLGGAHELRIPGLVVTFEPHPVQVLYPERNLQRIFPVEDQIAQIEKLGIDALVVEPFSREFSLLEPDKYFSEFIVRPFKPKMLVVGHDFSFGANRQGSIDFIIKQGAKLGFRVDVVEPVKVDSVPVSSSRIRKAILSGEVALANRLLGRRFYLAGVVEKGAGRGRKIGIPTANIANSGARLECVPACGVYAALATARGKSWPAAVNIGFNPTFQNHRGDLDKQIPLIEAHLIGFPSEGGSGDLISDLYGETVRIEFVQRIRDERKFSSVNELIEQIHRDIDEVLRLNSGEGITP